MSGHLARHADSDTLKVMAENHPVGNSISQGPHPKDGHLAVRLFYAFRSPYCYLVTERALALAESFRVRLEWRFMYPAKGSHEARMETPEVAYMRRDVARCAEAQGIELRLPSFIIQGRLAALASTFALQTDRGEEFLRAVARSYWVEGRDIDEVKVLKEAAEAAGIDPLSLEEALKDRRLEGSISANRRAARSLGVFGVPTFVIEKELFWGNDRYEFVVSELGRRGLER